MFFSSQQARFSGASIEGDWQGVTLFGIQSIEITDELDGEPMMGNGSVAIGMPAGSHKASITLETIPEEADALLQRLGNNFSQIPGSVGLSMSEPFGAGVYLVEVTGIYIRSCSFKAESGGQKGSTKTITGTVLNPVNWNGLRIVTDQRSGFTVDFGGLSL